MQDAGVVPIPMQKGGMAPQALSLLFAELNGVKRSKLTQ
jgi:hypothetical protein